MIDVARDLALLFGKDDGNQIVFGLDRRDGAFLEGSISVREDGEWTRLMDRNGIETLALRHLRDDVRDLLAHGGLLTFGDHDYGQMVTIEAISGGFKASVDLPSEDRWEIPIVITRAGLQRVVEVVDSTEARFGPLTEHCGCGSPPRKWQPVR